MEYGHWTICQIGYRIYSKYQTLSTNYSLNLKMCIGVCSWGTNFSDNTDMTASLGWYAWVKAVCQNIQGNMYVSIFYHLGRSRLLNFACDTRVHNRNNNFLISQPKHMLWVFKRTVSWRRFV